MFDFFPSSIKKNLDLGEADVENMLKNPNEVHAKPQALIQAS